MNKTEFKQYCGTQIVLAKPVTDIQVDTEKGWPIAIGRIEKEGYLMELPDGHKNWVQKNYFERNYNSTESMTFGLAIEAMKKGFRVSRKGWNGKSQFIELATSISYMTTDGALCNPCHDNIGNKAIAFVGTSGTQLGWLASQADMLADDWQVFRK